MIQRVAATFTAVTDAGAFNVRVPVAPDGAKTSVSDVISSVMLPAPRSTRNVIAVPRGYATDELAGIVHVLTAVSATGW